MNTVQQREIFLDAGLRVAERIAYDRLRVRDLIEEAQLPPITFEHLFGDLDDFAHALQQHLYEDLRETVVAAAASLPAGLNRLSFVAQAYLDRALSRRGAFSWVEQVGRGQKPLEDESRRQLQLLTSILSCEFSAIQAPYPAAAARLFVATLQAVAELEQASGRVEPDLRAAVRSFLKANSMGAA